MSVISPRFMMVSVLAAKGFLSGCSVVDLRDDALMEPTFIFEQGQELADFITRDQGLSFGEKCKLSTPQLRQHFDTFISEQIAHYEGDPFRSLSEIARLVDPLKDVLPRYSDEIVGSAAALIFRKCSIPRSLPPPSLPRTPFYRMPNTIEAGMSWDGDMKTSVDILHNNSI